ncbi:hypothetical protein [uncultured Draconibacterium sp.]|uniref:hypothetical protein n=1 Tax=uncultured Draconibacterium sp. TaxID=1573823 RepID=UPI0029C7270A|nr:hypothetical protein [uncultured Draconibacterium sp.]
MSRTFDFFSNIGDFKDVVSGVESSTFLSEMQGSYERAKQTIVAVIGQTLWDALKAQFASEGADAKKDQAVEHLQGAIGNRTYYHHLIFKVIGKKKEEVSFYKYEIQAMQENYLDAYWTYMDQLLTLFTSDTETFTGWTDTDMYKILNELHLKTANEFSKACGLDGSAYFFNRTIHLQLEVTDTDIASRKITAQTYADNARLERNIKRAIAYRTAAKAIFQFDYPDLPRSLRNDIYNEWSKTKGKQESLVKEAIAQLFHRQADEYFRLVDLELNQPVDEDGDSIDIEFPGDDINDIDNSHYLMS